SNSQHGLMHGIVSGAPGMEIFFCVGI
ncbi:MAG: hypothetical protein AWT59_3440, partial [Candidatus Gallionella acididurans]